MHTDGGYYEEGECIQCILAENVDPVLLKYKSEIKSFGYETIPMDWLEYNP